MDTLTKYYFNEFMHRELVRTAGQELSKSEKKAIIKRCEELAYRFSCVEKVA